MTDKRFKNLNELNQLCKLEFETYCIFEDGFIIGLNDNNKMDLQKYAKVDKSLTEILLDDNIKAVMISAKNVFAASKFKASELNDFFINDREMHIIVNGEKIPIGIILNGDRLEKLKAQRISICESIRHIGKPKELDEEIGFKLKKNNEQVPVIDNDFEFLINRKMTETVKPHSKLYMSHAQNKLSEILEDVLLQVEDGKYPFKVTHIYKCLKF